MITWSSQLLGDQWLKTHQSVTIGLIVHLAKRETSSPLWKDFRQMQTSSVRSQFMQVFFAPACSVFDSVIAFGKGWLMGVFWWTLSWFLNLCPYLYCMDILTLKRSHWEGRIWPDLSLTPAVKGSFWQALLCANACSQWHEALKQVFTWISWQFVVVWCLKASRHDLNDNKVYSRTCTNVINMIIFSLCEHPLIRRILINEGSHEGTNGGG